MLKRKSKLIQKYVSANSKVLDIGCGTGAFPEKLRKMGYQAIGVEPDKNAAAIAQNNDMVVYEYADDLLAEHTNTFHLITMWHVLEHITDPVQHLDLCHRLLVPEGILVVAVPLHTSFDAGFYKQHWAAWDLPRHLLHFNPETLVNTMQKSGFTLLQTRILPFDAYYISWLSERHKTNHTQPFAMLRAFITGFTSNLLARCSRRPASSQVFVFRKMSRQVN